MPEFTAPGLGKQSNKVVVDVEVADKTSGVLYALGGAGTVTLVVDGSEVGRAELKRTVPLAFTASETFDVGVDLGSTVSLNDYDRRPFAFGGQIKSVDVRMI